MNNTRAYWYGASICLLGGVLFYALHQDWLLFFCSHRWAPKLCTMSSRGTDKHGAHAARRKATLIFWHHDRWEKEMVDLVWPTDTAQAITYLLNSWLTLLDEEHITEQKITVQSVLLANNGTQALISFDRTPLAKESSTCAKWLLLEGLLKTIRENGIAITNVVFLVRHQPLRDYHLDFSNPWPIDGFFDKQR